MNDGFEKYIGAPEWEWEECYFPKSRNVYKSEDVSDRWYVVVARSGLIYITKGDTGNRIDDENFDTVKEAKFRLVMKYL